MKLTHISFVVGTILPLLTACEPESAAPHHTTTAALKNGNGAPPVEDVPADSASGADTRPNPFGPQHFAGAVLDQARAEAIAAGAGFDLVAFHRCALDSEECAMFEVQGPRNVFMYEVAATPCRRPVIFDQAYQASIGAARAARSSTSRAAQGENTDGTATGSTSVGANQGTTVFEAAAGDASYCFAGYTAAYRFREESILYSDYRGFEIKMEHHYQLIANGYWTDVATTITSSWDVQTRPDSSMRTQGWAYELRDSNDVVLGSDGESYQVIASGGSSSTDAELADRCEAKKNSMQTKHAVTIAVAEAACRLVTFFLPDSVTSSVGEGLSVEFTKEQDLCGGGANISTKISEAVGADIYEDCLENPGRYFPADYAPPGGDMDLDDIPGFKLPYSSTQEVGADESCSASMVTHETVDMGNGLICEADVRWDCGETTNGTCYCSNPSLASEISCRPAS